MPKNIAIAKRVKIDKAQQNMLAAVAGAALILGISLVFAVYLLKYIRFNTAVIGARDDAIHAYSDAIRNIGICTKPRGKYYNKSELEMCNPNDLNLKLSSIPDTLRYNVVMNLAQDSALESVGRVGVPICYDASTNERYSFDKIFERYNHATSAAELEKYLNMIGVCSSLRVIPDALPSTRNQLAVGSSLNKIFSIAQYTPETISPSDDYAESDLFGIEAISFGLDIETDSVTAMRVIENLEKSIREFSIQSATIERGPSSLKITSRAFAYYIEPATLDESLVTVTGKGGVNVEESEEVAEEEY